MSEQSEFSHTLADLHAAQGGDRAAASRLWERYYERLAPAVRSGLGPRLRRKLETMDVLQSVFLEAVLASRERKFATEGHFRSWLARLVRSRIRKKARYFSQQRRDLDREQPLSAAGGSEPVRAGPPDPRPISLVDHKDQLARLERSLERLPAEARQVLILRFMEDLPFSRIGELTNRSEEAARKMVGRAVNMLAREVNSRSGSAGQTGEP